MFSAIKDLGCLVSQKSINSIRRIEGKILAVVLSDDNTKFKEIYVEDFDVEKIDRYLYIEGATKGNNPAPIAQITSPDKTFLKVKQWLAKCEDLNKISEEDLRFVKTINQALNENEKNIIEKLKDLNLHEKGKKFITVKLQGGTQFLGDYKIFKNALDYFSKEKIKKSSASENVCSVCGAKRDEVSGKTDVFKFYTIDKPGFIAGGFKEFNAWKNFPVCMDCKDFLEKGKSFIESKLNFKFHGLSYLLIPRLLIGNNDILEEIISILTNTTQTISLKERIKKCINSDEDEILEYFAKKEDFLTVNFLFLQKQQSAERILLLIEDVFPSRIKSIFDAKDFVDNIFEKDFNFGKIRTFFSRSDSGKKNSDLDKYFLEIVDAVFNGKRLDFAFLVKFFMQIIRKEFLNDNYYRSVEDAMMNMVFFEKLGLIFFEEAIMEQSIFEETFTKYGKALNTPEKRGIFLLGALTQLLLNKQYSDRNSKPFMKKLKSLKMNEKDIKALLPEIQNKLEEYDAFDKGKREIATEAAQYLISAGENWKMSVDEINYYFACGLNLANKVAEIVYKKQQNNKEEQKCQD